MDEYINKQKLLEKVKPHQDNPFGIPLIIAEIEKIETTKIKNDNTEQRMVHEL